MVLTKRRNLRAYSWGMVIQENDLKEFNGSLVQSFCVKNRENYNVCVLNACIFLCLKFAFYFYFLKGDKACVA